MPFAQGLQFQTYYLAVKRGRNQVADVIGNSLPPDELARVLR
jgi:hypothetical protein